MKKPVAYVTDQALLKYLESTLQIDIEGLRAELAHKVDRERARVYLEGEPGMVVEEFAFRLVGNRVVAIAPEQS